MVNHLTSLTNGNTTKLEERGKERHLLDFGKEFSVHIEERQHKSLVQLKNKTLG